jgi:hypothetical protein
MKKFGAQLLFIIAASLASCQRVETTSENSNVTSSFVTDTSATGTLKQETVRISEWEVNNDSIIDSLTVNGLPFTINGLRCYWNYSVNILARKVNPQYNVRVITQDLVLQSNDSILLKVITSPDNYSIYYRLADLEGYPSYNIDCKDINKDSWCDYEILQERAAAGANTTTLSYLFNPSTNRFEYSELFSGTNVEYDSTENMIKTFFKMGVSNYVYTQSFLKPNKREVAYVIEEHHDGDSTTITKMIKGKVVSKRKVYEDDGQH